jgi:hypothetical protein
MEKEQWIIDTETELVNLLINSEDGLEDPLESYASIKHLSDLFASSVRQLAKLAVSESEDWPEKSFSHKGVNFTKVSGKRTWDYKNIPRWVKAKSELTEIEDVAKHIHSLYEQGKSVIDKDGEIESIPSCKISNDTLRVKFF